MPKLSALRSVKSRITRELQRRKYDENRKKGSTLLRNKRIRTLVVLSIPDKAPAQVERSRTRGERAGALVGAHNSLDDQLKPGSPRLEQVGGAVKLAEGLLKSGIRKGAR
jgi:hypothetical protein